MWTVDAHVDVKGKWVHLVDDATDSFFTELSVFHFQYKPKNYSKQIFAFTDQNQQHLVLNLNLKPCEQ